MPGDFGPYEILSEIGRGGMGIVYQAMDHQNNRLVAIKQLVLENVDPTKRREFRDRFRREAAMAARLDHPNVVSVFDVEAGLENNYYVMEFLDGHSLRRDLELRGGKMSPSEYAPVLRQVADGLDYAHSFNVVHRDVKPDNIFILKDGRVKLTDFGIARTVDYEQTHLTKTGVMLGTLAYVSPEQLQDAKTVDHRADIFSLGIVSYETLCGKLPFTGEGIASTVIKILSTEPESLHLVVGGISIETSAVVARAIRKKARDRYKSVSDFAKDFEQSLKAPPFNGVQLQQPFTSVQVARPQLGPVFKPGIPIERGKVITSGSMTPTPASSKVIFDTKLSSSPSSYYLVKPMGMMGKQGEADGCLMEPAVVCCRLGKIVVADSSTGKVQIFTKDGRFLSVVKPKSGVKGSQTDGRVGTPTGLAIDSRARVYVTDGGDQYIRVYDGQGVFIKEFCNHHGRDGGLQGVTCDSAGLLYVSDSDNGCLQVFDSDLGTWLRKIGTKGNRPGQIQLPSSIAVDRLNQVYIVDYGSSQVMVFSKSGSFIRCFGGKGTANGMFNVPRGIAIDKHDRIYVSDMLNHRVQMFGPAGDWLYSFGGKGHEAGKFIAPSSLSIDHESNRLYVADKGNHRIQIFELLGG